MKLALESLGKKATVIIGDSEIPKWTKFLPGGEQIVDKNYFEININEFDLFIILDGNATNRISQLGEIVFPPALKTIVIDHHQGEGCGQINLISTDYPATSSILADLFECWGVKISAEMAKCLMAGLHADTGGFKYPRTTDHIFNIAANLAAVAPDFTKVLNQIYGLSSLGSKRVMGHVFSNFELLAQGRLAVGVISQADFKHLGVKPEEAHNTGLSSMLREIEGVDVAALLVEEEPGVIKISTRSADGEKYDVSAAMKKFGGGGHKAAAGGKVTGSIEEVKSKLIEALTAIL
jgi:phosphoesterase RecJ-like protein